MSTTEHNGKQYTLQEFGDGKIELTPVKEKRKPEMGDVWYLNSCDRRKVLVTNKEAYVDLSKGYDPGDMFSKEIGTLWSDVESWTYEGKFEDLYTYNEKSTSNII